MHVFIDNGISNPVLTVILILEMKFKLREYMVFMEFIGLSNKLQLKSLHKGSSVNRGDYEISTVKSI